MCRGVDLCEAIAIGGLEFGKKALFTGDGPEIVKRRRSDGHLSAVGATQAAITTVGSITTAVGWRWADPAAAIVVGCVAVGVSFQTWIAGGE